jgi:hypothetical protein
MTNRGVIILVLMGGGVALAALGPIERCRNARAENRPDADAVCGYSGGGHGSGGGGGFHDTSGSHASVERGGFGSSGFHMFGS